MANWDEVGGKTGLEFRNIEGLHLRCFQKFINA
jgi:hypothetical protein